MNWQIDLVLIIVAIATIYLVRQTWRTWSGGKAGCGGKCSCAGEKSAAAARNGHVTVVPVDQLMLRKRDGSR
jgi:hypothetical protein